MLKMVSLPVVLSTLFVVLAPAAVAQEEVMVLRDYNLFVRWLEEPPFVGQHNGIVLGLEYEPTEQLVEGLGDSIDVQLKVGNAARRLPVRPAPDAPWRYISPVLLSEPGEYTVNVSGSVEGEEFDAEIELGEVRFLEDIAFPQRSELTADLENAAAELEARALQAQEQADDAQLLSVAALGVAAVSLIIIGAVFVYRR